METKPRIIAFYLPQYHVIPENDSWWGKGFTEWTNVKKTNPLFEGHAQPKVPLNDNYYSLDTTQEMVKQAKLAKEYGIDGFCYYHYWFNGKKLLDKPLDNMLSDKNVAIDFCMSWANEPWTRAWDGGEKEVLMAQKYGSELDWESHLSYLIPFFEDERYIKINGSPVFVIYRTESFSKFDKMIQFWNEKLESKGMNPLFIVETLTYFQKTDRCKLSKGVLEFEPMLTIGHSKGFFSRLLTYSKRRILDKGVYKIDYSKIWEKIINRKPQNYNGKMLFKGAFVDWDNTARKREKGLVLKNSSPALFKKYFGKLYAADKSHLIFINAWNEWAEGCYLEPDKKNGFAYLDAIKSISSKK